MDTHFIAKNLIDEFSATYGIPLNLSENGECAVLLNETVHVTLRVEPDANALLLHAPIGTIQDENNAQVAKLLREILDANYLWVDSGGATLSLAIDQLIAQRLVPLYELSAAGLAEYLAQISATVTEWRLRLENRTNPLPIETTTESKNIPRLSV